MTDEQRERAEYRRKELEHNIKDYNKVIKTEAERLGYDGTEPRRNYYRRVLIDCLTSYFRNRDIPIDGLKFQKIPTAVYCDAFRYCHDELEKNGDTIDLDNMSMIEDLANAYETVIERYAIKAHPKAFCSLIDIDIVTFDRWKNDTQKVILFLDKYGNRIGGDNPELYKRAHPGEEVHEVLSISRGECFRRIHAIYTASAETALNDFQLGLIANANHNKRMGLEYQKQSLIESAQIQQALNANELPRLSLENGSNPSLLPDIEGL